MARFVARALGRARDALRAKDAETHAAFEEESATFNLRSIKISCSVLSVFHVVHLVLLRGAASPTPEHSEWLKGLTILHATMLAVAIAALSIARFARSTRAKLLLADAVAAIYVLGGSLMSANVQRLQPNLNMFTFAALLMGVLFRVRPAVYAGALALGVATVAGAMLHFLRDPAVRTTQILSLLAIASLALAIYAVMRVFRIRDVSTRRQVERMNADLTSRVASQVEEITKRAKEVEQLNVQLNRQVRERSRELSMALARLAGEHKQLSPGTVLGDRVEIERRIGEGGMGAVYRARDLVTGGAVAVKVVQAGSINELDGLFRFLREAQVLASLTHPAIVRSFHLDVADDGRLFQVMELVTGETLQEWLGREGALPVPSAARLGAVLADALALAHRSGVVHRDVKPANVMLTSETPGIKLLDFGISKLRDVRGAHGHTGGAVLGTLEFLSPEQISDPSRVTDRADVYALGLVLYLAIAGRLPYDPKSARSWLVAHVTLPPEDLAAVVGGIDREVASTVMACLRKEPDERPSAAEVARSLAAAADRLGCPSLESIWVTTRRTPPDRPSPDTPTVAVRHEVAGRRTLKVVR